MESLFASVFVIQYLVLIRPGNYARKQLIPGITNTTAEAHTTAGTQPGAGSSTRTKHLGSHPDTGHPSCWNRTRSRIYVDTWKCFHAIPVSSEPQVHLVQLHSPNVFLLAAVLFLQRHLPQYPTTRPSEFLPPSHFQSLYLCCLHSKHNFCLRSSNAGHLVCYQQELTSPSQPIAHSLRLAPKEQLMKCKTSGLFD